jgi:threonine 3-dehydrogenase
MKYFKNIPDSKNILRSLIEFMTVPEHKLKKRCYNVTAMSFTPEELANKLAKHVPELKITYRPDSRQKIGMEYINILHF